MKELTLKANRIGGYDLYVDGELVKDAQAVELKFDIDKMIHPEINIRYAMFDQCESFTTEEFDAYESGVIAKVLNNNKLKECKDEILNKAVQETDQEDGGERTEK